MEIGIEAADVDLGAAGVDLCGGGTTVMGVVVSGVCSGGVARWVCGW